MASSLGLEAISRKPHIPSTPPTSTAHKQTPLFPHTTENCFSDLYGRTVLLRGLNVGGCSKVPEVGNGTLPHEEVINYTGKPFKSIQEADQWWARLRLWGVSVVRWVVTWEAIEPKESGQYDEEYISYMYKVLQKAGENGLKVFMDVHQDCWSRLSGGSGAPAWTFTTVGLDPRKFHSTYTSAIIPPHPDAAVPSEKAPYVFSEPHLPPHQTPLSKPSSHLWPTNYSKLSTATMFTIFFAGETFAPKAKIRVSVNEEKNVGSVLQDAYIAAFRHVSRKLASLDCILGWDVMNEPHPGFIGLPNLKQWNQDTELHLGVMASGIQGMVLASGGEGAPNQTLKLKLPIYHRSWPRPSSISGYVDYGLSKGGRVWSEGRKDLWKEEGVWWWDVNSAEGYSYKPDYFTKHPQTGSPIDFERDFYEPFLRRFLTAVREGRSQGLQDLGLPPTAGMGQWSFIEPVPNIGPPNWVEEANGKELMEIESAGGFGVCYAPHWYDLRACFEKRLSYTLSFDVGALALGSRNFFQHSYFGRLGLLGNYKSQFTRLVGHVKTFRKSMKPTPVLVGETGVPFDINGFEAYKTGDVHWQMVMLDSVTGAMERVGRGNLNWTLWNFTGENYVTIDPRSGTLESGDGWNSEDFSLISMDPAMTEVCYSPETTIALNIRRKTKSVPSPNNKGVPLTRAKVFGDLYKGARCVGAWIRPYPAKIAGILHESKFTLANIDSGTRACWGGVFEMRYVTSSAGDSPNIYEHQEISRTTEIFLPAYHFGGEQWTLQLSISKPRSAGAVVATIFVNAVESRGAVEIQSVPQGNISWTYSEGAQSLNITHTPQLQGWTIQVLAQAGVSGNNGRVRGAIAGESNILKQVLVLLVLGVLGAVASVLIGSWHVSETMIKRRVEYHSRRG